jgi:hypothetical protein
MLPSLGSPRTVGARIPQPVVATARRLACLAIALAAGAVDAAPVRNIDRALEVPAGVTRVALDVGTGSLVLRPSPDGRLHLHVELTARTRGWGALRWTSSRAERLVESGDVALRSRDASLEVAMTYPAAAGDLVEERWEVEVPESLAARIRINVGDADLRGLPGGIDAEVNVGDLRMSLGSGDARGHTNVGRLIAEVDGVPFAHATLDVNLGEVSAEVGGTRLPAEAVPPPAARLTVVGQGSAEYRLSANVGSVRLAVRQH